LLSGGTPCKSRLINIPTGLGKTAAVMLAWLWNRSLSAAHCLAAGWRLGFFSNDDLGMGKMLVLGKHHESCDLVSRSI
jgi:hypothetical protein